MKGPFDSMKILHLCPTFLNPTCGIGKYSRTLYEAIPKTVEQQVQADGLLTTRHSILRLKPQVVHLQLEYGFCSTQRLELISNWCTEAGALFAITYHTVGYSLHNKVPAALKFVHTPTRTAAEYGLMDAIQAPMAVPVVQPDFTALGDPLLNFLSANPRPVMFFGQAHPHKGLRQTLVYCMERDIPLVVVASRPVQGDPSYYDECRKLATSGSGRVWWVDEYLSDSAVVAVGMQCSAAVFPYQEYGAIGCSAAVGLLLNCPTLRILTTWSSHFCHLPGYVVEKYESTQELLEACYIPTGPVVRNPREAWVELHRPDKVAVGYINRLQECLVEHFQVKG